MEGAHQAAELSLPRERLASVADQSAGRRRLRRIGTAAKIGFTVLAFVLVARMINPAALLERARRTEPLHFFAAVLLSIIQIPLVGLRWRLIVQAMSDDPRRVPGPARFQQITFIAQFFGQVLPFVAGDGLRVLLLREAGASLRVAFKSTLLDRGIAALALFALTLPGILLSPLLASAGHYLVPVTLFVAAGLLGAAVTLLCAPVLARFGARWRVVGAVTETVLDLRNILTNGRCSVQVVGLCVLVHAISMAVFWLLARGQQLPFQASDAAAVVPLVLLVAMLPIAVGGWGLREGFVVALLGAAGIGSESALLLSVSFGTVLFLAALPGLAVLAVTARAGARAAASVEI